MAVIIIRSITVRAELDSCSFEGWNAFAVIIIIIRIIIIKKIVARRECIVDPYRDGFSLGYEQVHGQGEKRSEKGAAQEN